MKLQSIILVGGGEHCSSCFDVIGYGGKFNIAGVSDSRKIRDLPGYQVLGGGEQIARLAKETRSFLVTVKSIKTAVKRRARVKPLSEGKTGSATMVSDHAHVYGSEIISERTVVMQVALENSSTITGKHYNINSAALIEHDAVISDSTNVSAVVNGNCRVGASDFIGSNDKLANGVKVCDGPVTGAGVGVSSNSGNPERMQVLLRAKLRKLML